MAKQFDDQGGAATMDPSRTIRFLTSRLMSREADPARLAKRRQKRERLRTKEGRPHRVEYFHQPEDGYSHLAAQVLAPLCERYDIDLVCHIVPGPAGKNLPEPELLLKLSRYESLRIAPEYGLRFPGSEDPPASELVTRATALLANLSSEQFSALAAPIGDALWAGDESAMGALEHELGGATLDVVTAKLKAGEARRHSLAHYSGAMFYYEGEWYWGVDRLYHLEQRLAALGADNTPGEPLLVPRPDTETGPLRDENGQLTLEVYPSLRSPYTSISFDRTVALAAATGVNLVTRPVLPMVMRGVPATRQKGMYIFFDTAREAREAGVPYGRFYDPIGEPARRAYSLYPWAVSQGKGNELLSAFLSCAFAQGVNTLRTNGMKRVVQQAGLDWKTAEQHLGDPAWEDLLETNRQAMYAAGLWGVPSFRLLGPAGEEILALWGQDRLWVIAREIQRQLALLRQDL